jgi:hypothetical protein
LFNSIVATCFVTWLLGMSVIRNRKWISAMYHCGCGIPSMQYISWSGSWYENTTINCRIFSFINGIFFKHNNSENCFLQDKVLVYIYFTFSFKQPSKSWWYGRWIYNYLCNQCLSPLMLRVRILLDQARCTSYNIMW